MNTRISLQSVATRLQSQLTVGYSRIGTVYDTDFAAVFAKTFNQVWVIGQRTSRMNSIDSDDGYAGRFRQHMRVDIMVRVVTQRAPEGVFNNETALTTVCNDVSAALLKWTPTGAERAFVWVEQRDGPLAESVVTADLVFSTIVTYSS